MTLSLIQEIKTQGSYDFDANRKVEAIEVDANKQYVKEILKSLKETFTKYFDKYRLFL